MCKNLLEVNNLKTSFYSHLGEIQAVRGISFSIDKGEIVGIVGESGSGKSVTAMSIIKLLQYPGKIKDGEIIFKGSNIINCNKKEMMNIRGNQISMIFQDPMTSLNPVYTIGDQIMEVFIKHQKISKIEAEKRSVEMLRLVGIPSPELRINSYPHQLSGGMRQRIMISMALSCKPDLLIADEPTTALDVTIQAQIMELMQEIRMKLGTSIMLITHDLCVVAEMCSRIIVMYGGLIMEEGNCEDILTAPKHPYTIGLLKSVPTLNNATKTRLTPMRGSPPDLLKPPIGCPFASRCNYAMKICIEEMPDDAAYDNNHRVACWLHHSDAPKIEFNI